MMINGETSSDSHRDAKQNTSREKIGFSFGIEKAFVNVDLRQRLGQRRRRR